MWDKELRKQKQWIHSETKGGPKKWSKRVPNKWKGIKKNPEDAKCNRTWWSQENFAKEHGDQHIKGIRRNIAIEHT